MSLPLMPKATAVWLVENTALSFPQIAKFCGLHPLEVKGIADGEVFQGIVGQDPIAQGQLSQAEIDRCTTDPAASLTLIEQANPVPRARSKGPRYTPVSRRQDRPDAIAWLLRNHSELSDPQICRLIGTTKPTIKAVRDRSHWNSQHIKPLDPVTLGLCSQIELDGAIQKANERRGGDPEDEAGDEYDEIVAANDTGRAAPADEDEEAPAGERLTAETLFRTLPRSAEPDDDSAPGG